MLKNQNLLVLMRWASNAISEDKFVTAQSEIRVWGAKSVLRNGNKTHFAISKKTRERFA